MVGLVWVSRARVRQALASEAERVRGAGFEDWRFLLAARTSPSAANSDPAVFLRERGLLFASSGMTSPSSEVPCLMLRGILFFAGVRSTESPRG